MRRDHERRQPTLGVNSVLLINYAEFAFIEIPETSTSIINYGLLSLSLSLSLLSHRDTGREATTGIFTKLSIYDRPTGWKAGGRLWEKLAKIPFSLGGVNGGASQFAFEGREICLNASVT